MEMKEIGPRGYAFLAPPGSTNVDGHKRSFATIQPFLMVMKTFYDHTETDSETDADQKRCLLTLRDYEETNISSSDMQQAMATM